LPLKSDSTEHVRAVRNTQMANKLIGYLRLNKVYTAIIANNVFLAHFIERVYFLQIKGGHFSANAISRECNSAAMPATFGVRWDYRVLGEQLFAVWPDE
jgi:hypothetical protein